MSVSQRENLALDLVEIDRNAGSLQLNPAHEIIAPIRVINLGWRAIVFLTTN